MAQNSKQNKFGKKRNKDLYSRMGAQKAHTLHRGMKRYGVVINDTVQAALCTDIKHGRAGFIEQQVNERSAWLVELEDRWIPVIFDNKTKVLVTTLPMEFLQGKTVMFGGPTSNKL